MKIVYCIVGTFNAGGMERVLANKANYLSRLGHELFIVTTDQQGRTPYFKLDAEITQLDLGINYRAEADRGMFSRIFAYLRKQKRHRRLLTKLLFNIRPDVVISMFDHEASLLYKIKDGSKKVLEIHFSRFKRLQYARKGLWALIDQFRSDRDLFLAKQYDRFVVLTEEDKLYWGDLPNIQVIPNANSFQPEVMAELKAKQAIAVGRYDHQKGFDSLIRAWAMIYRIHPEWSLSIFGQGPDEQKLQQLIDELNLRDAVQLCGPVNDIESAYLSSTMLVMTSRYEGLPMALLEGQACGLPLVSYACKCGPRDIIRDGENGFLVAEQDEETLAKKVIRLIEVPELRKAMGRKSRQLSLGFAESVIMDKWISLFNTPKN